MYFGVYCRVSTGQQVTEGTSLDRQVDMCIKRALEKGITQDKIIIYKEAGASGEDVNRPEMNRLREDVRSGKVTTIICMHPDRLSRDLTDKLIVCREFEKHEATLEFVDTEYKNTPEGQLFFNMQSAIAQYELSMIRKRTTSGRLRRVEKDGKVMPMRVSPFGYDFGDGQLFINEKEAEIVKLIYQWYVFDQLTYREIGDKLYQLGVMPKRKESKNWGASSIQRILTSEIYIGKYIYNKRKTKKVRGEKTKAGNAKKTYEIRDKEDWITVDVPQIIDEHIYQLAQEKKNSNLTWSGNVKYDYLLKSLIRCPHCGRKWQATTYTGKNKGEKVKYRCYRCPNKYPKKYGEYEKCESDSLRADKLEDAIWNIILEIINNPYDVLNETKNYQDNKVNKNDAIKTLNLLKEQIETKEKQKEKIKKMFILEVISEDEMLEDISKINKEIKTIQSDINKYEEQNKVSQLNEIKYKQINESVSVLSKKLKGKVELSFKEKRAIIDLLIDEILIDARDGKFGVTFIGLINDFILSSQHQNNMYTKQSKEYAFRTRFSENKKPGRIGLISYDEVVEERGFVG